MAPTEMQQAVLKLTRRESARAKIRIPPSSRTARGLWETKRTLPTEDREAAGKSPTWVHEEGSPVRRKPVDRMHTTERRAHKAKMERRANRRAKRRAKLRAQRDAERRGARAGAGAGVGFSSPGGIHDDLSSARDTDSSDSTDSSGMDTDERKDRAERAQLEKDRFAAAAAAAAGNKKMGGRDHEMLNPANRNGAWHRSIDFATFYKWYMRDTAAQTFRLRRPLEVLRHKIVHERVFDRKLLAIRPGGEHMIRRHVVDTMRKDIIPAQREVFRNANPPVAQCGKCGRGFALRRDKKEHQKSGVCVLRDYGLVPDAYRIRGDGGFVRGKRMKTELDSASEDSATSLSDM